MLGLIFVVLFLELILDRPPGWSGTNVVTAVQRHRGVLARLGPYISSSALGTKHWLKQRPNSSDLQNRNLKVINFYGRLI